MTAIIPTLSKRPDLIAVMKDAISKVDLQEVDFFSLGIRLEDGTVATAYGAADFDGKKIDPRSADVIFKIIKTDK